MILAACFRVLLWSAAAASTVLFVTLAVRRLFHPLELDIIEGVMMDHVVRLSEGRSIYVAPSLSFIPLAYMPLFPTVAAGLAKLFGPGFWEPRLISLLAVAGIVALLFRIVRAETRSVTLAAGGAAVYLMGFGLTGSCYDVARPDSLMLFLALAGLATLRFSTGQGGAVFAALLLSLALLTKQHAAWFLLAAFVQLAVNERHRLRVFALWVVVFAGGAIGALHAWLNPWFLFYTLEVPGRWSSLSGVRILNYLGHHLFGTLGLLAGASLLTLALPIRPWRGRDGIWLWVGLAAVGSGLMATLDEAAYRHTLMPTMMALALLGPISLHRLAEEIVAARGAPMRLVSGVVCGVLAVQFAPLAYVPRDRMPRADAARASAEFVQRLQQIPGPVLVPYHGFYSWRAGKGSSLHMIPLDDLARARGNTLARLDPAYLDKLFQPLLDGPSRPTIVTDVELASTGTLWKPLGETYAAARPLGPLSEQVRPLTGNRLGPSFVYEPKAPPPPAVPVVLDSAAAGPPAAPGVVLGPRPAAAAPPAGAAAPARPPGQGAGTLSSHR